MIMSYYDRTDYRQIYSHVRFHNIRKWLMDGARREDARTIREAVERMSDDQLDRRFARMLAQER
jgi:hypothetical protein